MNNRIGEEELPNTGSCSIGLPLGGHGVPPHQLLSPTTTKLYHCIALPVLSRTVSQAQRDLAALGIPWAGTEARPTTAKHRLVHQCLATPCPSHSGTLQHWASFGRARRPAPPTAKRYYYQ